MRKFGYSLFLAAILVASLAFTVYSQRDSVASDSIQILTGGVQHQFPVDITLVLPSETGPQTVTVPVMLNLDLTVGPVEALHLDIQADSPVQFVSPLRVTEPVTASSTVTRSLQITATGTVTE